MHIEHLWIAALTRNIDNAETDDKPQISFNPPGGPFFFSDIPFANGHLGRGRAGLARLNIESIGAQPHDIDLSLAAGGNNLWRIGHVAAWGERADSGNVVPLSFGAAPPEGLSQQSGEGIPNFLLPPVLAGDENMVIRRLLIVVHTNQVLGLPIAGGNIKEFGTDSPINLQIGTEDGIVVDYDFPDTPQADQELFQANYYIAPVVSPFTRGELSDRSVVLSIKGTDSWSPGVVAVFGIESPILNTTGMVPIVHSAPWPFGRMSTDPDEGREHVRIPLAPMDSGDLVAPPTGDVVLQLRQRVADLERRLGVGEVKGKET